MGPATPRDTLPLIELPTIVNCTYGSVIFKMHLCFGSIDRGCDLEKADVRDPLCAT
jgi:hypothetical protein